MFVPKGKPAVSDPTGVKQAVIDAVTAFQAVHPRTLQRRLGPSEVGDPCARQIAYKLMEFPENPDRGIDPWPSFLGIAAHARLADALEHDNKRAPGTWVTERRLTLPGIVDGGSGQSDAYYRPSLTTVDWKVLGNTSYDEIAKNGPGHKYRVQGHTYGLGWTVAGYKVEHVGIGVFGRAKPLTSMFVWSEPFNPQLAIEALQRVADIRKVVDWLQQQQTSMWQIPRVDIVPPSPGKSCFYCEFRGDPLKGWCDA